MQTNSGERIAWVDRAKGIGILLVVYGHVARGVYNAGIPMDRDVYMAVDSAIYSFHMPLFFLISGLLFREGLERNGLHRFLSKKTNALLFTYFIWSIIQGVLEVGLSEYTNHKVGLTDVATLLWQPRAQFWFLYVLFVVTLINLLVVCIFESKGSTVSMIVAASMFFASGEFEGIAFALQSVAVFSVYFSLGMVISGTRADYVYGLTGFLMMVLFYGFFGASQEGFGVTFAASMWKLAVALIGITITTLLSILIPDAVGSAFEYFGKRSFEIYLLHVLAASGARIVMQKVFAIESLQVHIIFGLMMGVMIPIIISRSLRNLRFGFLLSPSINFVGR